MQERHGNKYLERIKKALNGLPGGILFLALFLIILVPLSYCLRTNGDIKEIFNGFYGEKNNALDVVMIGSSPVYPCLAAPKMWEDQGITAYPLSSNMQRPKATVHLIEEAEKTQDPGLYIFELRMYLGPDERLTENMAYTRGVVDNMKYSFNRVKAVNDLVPADDEDGRHTYYFDIFKYHSNWKTLIMPSQLATFAYSRPHPMKGATVKDHIGPCELTDRSGVTERKAVTPDMEETLRELCAYLQKEGHEALFLVIPYNLTEEDQMQYNYLADIVQEAGFDYWNMNDHYEEMNLDPQLDFADYGTHTNAYGMEKCSAFLGEYLAEHYDFADKRGNADFADWDEAAVLWREATEAAKVKILERLENEDFFVPEGEL